MEFLQTKEVPWLLSQVGYDVQCPWCQIIHNWLSIEIKIILIKKV